MIDLAILVPVLRRPKNIDPLLISVNKSTEGNFIVVFITSPSDHEERIELTKRNQYIIIMEEDYLVGDYARKINTAFKEVEAEWYFLGADDLRFYPGWFDSAMEIHRKTNACVIGTNDLGNPRVKRGLHSTHSLVLRDYVLECGTIDEPGKILYEGYPHEFVDDEFIETAKWRGAWAFSKESKVEHLHPNWKKSAMDPIYAEQVQRMNKGRVLFDLRKKLWP